MTIFYPVHYCLNNETEFEENHPDFDRSQNELVLSIREVGQILDKCTDKSDNIGISFGGEISGKWDVLEIQGVNGAIFNLQYLISGTLFTRKNVTKSYVLNHLKKVNRTPQELLSLDYQGKSI